MTRKTASSSPTKPSGSLEHSRHPYTTKQSRNSSTTNKMDDPSPMIVDPFVFVDNPLAAEAKKEADKATLRKLDSLEASRESSNNANTLELELTENPSAIPPLPATTNKETTTLPTLLMTRMSPWLSLSKKNSSLSAHAPHQSSISSSVENTISISQQDDYRGIKLAFFWMCACFLLQSLVFVVTAKKIFFPEPETY